MYFLVRSNCIQSLVNQCSWPFAFMSINRSYYALPRLYDAFYACRNLRRAVVAKIFYRSSLVSLPTTAISNKGISWSARSTKRLNTGIHHIRGERTPAFTDCRSVSTFYNSKSLNSSYVGNPTIAPTPFFNTLAESPEYKAPMLQLR